MDAAGGDGAAGRLDAWLRRHGMQGAMIVAFVATLGSLYFSEIMGFVPCRLCWFQRIFMYPLAIILPIGIARRDRGLAGYVLPLAVIGGSISTYHVLLQKTHLFSDACAVHGDVPCSSAYIHWLGFITIPVLALSAFALIGLAASAGASFGSDRDAAVDAAGIREPEADARTRRASILREVVLPALLVVAAFGALHAFRIAAG